MAGFSGMRPRPLLARLLVAAACLVTAGCGGPPRVSIAGTVTLDGQPLDRGTILFVPQQARGGPSGCDIVAGAYSLSQGLSPGLYRVEIRQRRPSRRLVQKPYGKPGETVADTEEGVAADANVESTLVAELQAGANTADYAVRSRPRQ